VLSPATRQDSLTTMCEPYVLSAKVPNHAVRTALGKRYWFQSLSKIAVATHISPQRFSFKFDTRCLCGMIDPEWMPFPRQRERAGTTQFLLELAPDAPKDRIKSDLRAFNPSQLLFLRRPRRAEVSVDGEVMEIKREDYQDFGDCNGETRRLTVSNPIGKKEIVTDYLFVRNKAM